MKTNLFSIIVAVIIYLLPFQIHAKNTLVNNVSELTTAVASAIAGDSIILNDGIYKDFHLTITQSGTADKMITIMAKNGGKVKLQGQVGFNITASHVYLSGFDFEGAIIHDNDNTLFNVTGNYNVIEDMNVLNVSNGKHVVHRYIMLQQTAKNNTIKRCWFEKGTQRGMCIFGYIQPKDTSGTFNVVEQCYFKAARQPENGGSAIRFGSGMSAAPQNGSNIIRNCLFDEYNGEEEIFSIKSSENILENNTYLNCYGMLSFRHCHNNIVRNSFIINNDPNVPEGSFFCIWGKGHQITNNYFYKSKRTNNTSGTISLVSGNGDLITSKYEAVANVLIKDNIIYESDTTGYSITVGARHGSMNRTIVPRDVTITGNCIYNSSNNPQIYYAETPDNITYTDNLVYKNVGITPVLKGITTVAPKFNLDKYGIYRVEGKGPNGNPLTKEEVGPIWKRNYEELKR